MFVGGDPINGLDPAGTSYCSTVAQIGAGDAIAGGITAGYALYSAPADAVPVVGEANLSFEAAAGGIEAIIGGGVAAAGLLGGCL